MTERVALYRRKLLLLAAGWVSVIVPVQGQVLHADGPLPSFEVATIKPGDSQSRWPTSNEYFLGVPTRSLIRMAYNLPPGATGRMVGGPDWIRTDPYTFDMKIDGATAEAMQKMRTEKRDEQVHLMMQSLLADRFKMKVHFEMRELPIYELVVTKGGAKLTPAKHPTPTGVMGPAQYGHPEEIQRGMIVSAVGTRADGSVMTTQTARMLSYTLQDLAYHLMGNQEVDGRTIVDKTGITGVYDISLTLSSRLANSGDQISLFTAVQEQLGLKLVPGKGMVEVLVIDSIERPSEN